MRKIARAIDRLDDWMQGKLFFEFLATFGAFATPFLMLLIMQAVAR